MSFKQRKEVIKQIEDLATGKKAVAFGSANSHGIAFSNDPVIDTTGIGQDRVIEWDCLSYQEYIDDMPTMAEFINIDNIISPSISQSTVISLNGLTYNSATYGLNTKYSIRVTTRTNITKRFTFSGYCKAILYINGNPVMYHVDDATTSEMQESVSSPVTMNTGIEYDIAIITYGHLANSPSASINLTSDIFRYLASVSQPAVPAPSNVTATTDLVDGIRIGWELPYGAQLPGGGVEIIGIPRDTPGATGSIVGRAPFPSTSFMHSVRSEAVSLLNNSNFQSVQSYGVIPNSDYDDLTGLTDWEVAYEPWCSVSTTPSSILSDYSICLQVASRLATTIPFNAIAAFSLGGNGTEVNYPSNDPKHGVILPYTASCYIQVAPSSTVTSVGTGDATVVVNWTPPGVDSPANVQLIVLNGVTPVATITTNIESGQYSYALTGAGLSAWHTAPENFKVLVSTSVALLNGGSASTSYVNLYSVYVVEDLTVDEATPVVTFKSAPVVFQKSTTLQYDVLGILSSNGNPTVFVDIYDANMQLIQQVSSGLSTYKIPTKPSGSALGRYKGTLSLSELASTTGVYLRGGIYFFASNDDLDGLSATLQFLRISATSGQTLGAGSRYAYYLRSFTNTMNYSDTIGPIYGEVPTTIYSMRIDAASPYISSFKKSSVVINSNTPLNSLVVRAENSNESISVPYTTVLTGNNNSRFTCELSPLLSSPVIFDTFVHDYSMAELALGDTYVATNTFVSTEDSPTKSYARYVYTTPGTMSINNPVTGGIWLGELSEQFNTNLHFNSATSGTYKEYLTSGNHDDFGDAEFYNDGTELSAGMVVVFTSTPVFNGTGESNVVVLTKQNTFNLAYDSYNHRLTAQVRQKLTGPSLWNIRLRSSFTPVLGVPYFIHASVDIKNLQSSERTYIYAINMATGAVSSGATTTETLIASNNEIDWATPTNVRVGVANTTSGLSPNWIFYINTVYLTAGVTEATILVDHIVPHILTRSPLFTTFGFDSLESAVVTAEGVPQTSIDANTQVGSVALDVDQILADTTILVDNETPDGTMYILRDTYTLRQDDIDTMSISQPLYTYSRINKVMVDFTPTGTAGIDEVRFSNDRISWGPYITYNRQVLYPWELLELSTGEDATAGAIRYVWTQVRTASGIATDPFLQPTHYDSIIYNPLAAIGGIESYNYLKGVSGWAIDLSGTAEFSDTIIRRASINLSRNIDSLLLSQNNIGLQIDKEYNIIPFSRSDTFVHSTLAKSTNLVDGTAIKYGSNIVSNIRTGANIYIPALGDVVSGLGRRNYVLDYNVDTATANTYNAGTGPSASAALWLPSVSLVDGTLFVSSVAKIEKFNGAVMSEDQLDATYVLPVANTYCIGHKSCYTTLSELRVYVISKHITNQDYYISVLDQDLSLLQQVTINHTSSVLGTNCIDVNGIQLAFADGLGYVYLFSLNEDGLFGVGQSSIVYSNTTELNAASTQFNFTQYTTANTAGHQLGLQGSVSLVIRYPTGVSFFGRSLFMFTEPGINPFSAADVADQMEPDGYQSQTLTGKRLFNILASGTADGNLSFLSYASGRVEDLTTTYNEYNTITTEWNWPPFFVLDDPSLTPAEIATFTTRPVYTDIGDNLHHKAPYTTRAATSNNAQYECALGFLKPMCVNKQIYIPCTSSTHASGLVYNASSILIFNTNGKTLGSSVDIITGYSDRKLLSTFYDGKYYIELKADQIYLRLDISQM